MTDVKAESEDHAPDQPHPSTFSPATFALLIVLAIFGAIIGIQLILQLGVTPNTSIIGALVAMILARVPLTLFARYRSVHAQNLAQSNISAATFGAANSLLVPIGIPFLLGRGDLILPMLVGAALAMLLDAYYALALAPTAESSPAPENFFQKRLPSERLPPLWAEPFLDRFLSEGA
jgi:uncharacterized oligopeptide transporter (OPT) family protein